MKKNRNSGKKNIIYSTQPMYPNAAAPSYFMGKLLQIVTAVLSGMGLVSVTLLFITMA